MYQYLQSEKAPRILVEAVKLIGIKEIVGKQHNPVILEWAEELGLEKVYTNDEIPWCGLFAAICAKRANVQVVKLPLRALSWAEFGNKVDQPMLGDILTFKRKGGGHVGFYVGEDDECYHVLGGNQGNMVKPSRIEKSRLYQARRTAWKIAQPVQVRVIKLSSTGEVSKNEQ